MAVKTTGKDLDTLKWKALLNSVGTSKLSRYSQSIKQDNVRGLSTEVRVVIETLTVLRILRETEITKKTVLVES